eukprot:CAMPEP_0168265442 /NCGR_PEP_ID=MMETSP0141_2-20121125/11783_1 /TAXON_ID=44445 /ORGANISM="Pseudo-nitzschia australis, Strain 10249 10 AB" /LENGTH=200 /DNA_ID=CAMNT_0008204995 /DNA_START=639 /DNA_END=1238 /DNA_ORIENTATION=+
MRAKFGNNSGHMGGIGSNSNSNPNGAGGGYGIGAPDMDNVLNSVSGAFSLELSMVSSAINNESVRASVANLTNTATSDKGKKKKRVDEKTKVEEPEKGTQKKSKKVDNAPVMGIRSRLTTTMTTRTVATNETAPIASQSTVILEWSRLTTTMVTRTVATKETAPIASRSTVISERHLTVVYYLLQKTSCSLSGGGSNNNT